MNILTRLSFVKEATKEYGLGMGVKALTFNPYKGTPGGYNSYTRTYFTGGYGGIYGNRYRVSGSRYDWRAEAGILYDNSIVGACLQWACKTVNEAPVAIIEVDDRGIETYKTNVGQHKILKLLAKPMPFYDWGFLSKGIVASLMLTGNCFLYKHRSKLGKLVGIEYIPYLSIYPVRQKNSKNFIDWYEQRTPNGIEKYKVEDIIHIRYGPCDQLNPLVSMSPLVPVLREICTDNEAATYSVTMLKNEGRPSHILSPKDSDKEGVPINFSETQANELKKLWTEKFTGDRRGEPLISSLAVELQKLSYNPEELVLDKIRNIPEERITAMYSIPAVVLGLGTGLEYATAKASHKESREQAYENFVVPMQNEISTQLTNNLREEITDLSDNEHIVFDRRKIAAVQESVDNRHQRARADYRAGLCTREEARSICGMEPQADETNGFWVWQEPRGNNIQPGQESYTDNTNLNKNGKEDKRHMDPVTH